MLAWRAVPAWLLEGTAGVESMRDSRGGGGEADGGRGRDATVLLSLMQDGIEAVTGNRGQ